MTNRPKYTPEPGDTADDRIAALERDVAWLEAANDRACDAVMPDPVLAEITTERRRQIEVEGWTPYHDDEHGNAQLARAAAAYALNTAALTYSNVGSQKAIKAEAEAQWPWAAEWWKPTTPRRDLIKAAALIVAEIERLDRDALRDAARGAGG